MSQDVANQIAQHFTDYLNEWHSIPEVFDNELDAQLHRWYAEVKPVFPKKPYFSPSSINSCQRELYLKTIGAKKDNFPRPPYQARWTRIGTAIGDIIQRDLLIAERHYERLTGKPAPFVFERDEQGRPMFEDFAKRNVPVHYRGHTFYLYGAPDGIMRYITPDGEVIRIGLEVKSKQTSASKTSVYSMNEAELKHVKQTIGYSKMYDVDYYLILYVNAAKKAWVYSDSDFEKNPDIRAFGLHFTEADREQLYEYVADILDAVKAKKPPALDLTKWTFNNFKTASALSLTDDEFDEIKTYVRRVLKSGLPNHEKEQTLDAYEFIKEIREKEDVIR